MSGDPARRRLPALAGAIATLILLALVTLPYNAATRATTWPWWLAARALPLLAVAWWLRQSLAKTASSTVAGLSGWRWGLLAFGGINVVSAALSAHPRESADAALLLAGFVGFVLALATWLEDGERRRSSLAVLVAGGGLVFALVSLGLWIAYGAAPAIARVRELNAAVGADVFSLDPHGFRNDQPLGHSNYTAGVCILVLPWLGWGVMAARGLVWRVISGAGGLLVFAVMLLSGSRGALIGLAGAAGCAVIYAARAARWSLRRVALSGAAGLLLLVLLVLAVPRVRNSAADLWHGREPNSGDRQRLAMVDVGLAMGAERWWIGQGPGLTPRLYPIYRHRVEGGTPTILQLHSTPIQIWADTGLPGLLLGAGLLGWALWSGFRRVRRTADGAADPPWVVAAAGVSLAGYTTFALTDYQMDLPVVLAVLAVDFAVLLATASGPAIAWSRRVAVGIAGVWLIGGIVLSIPEARARRVFARAVHDLERGGPADAFNTAALTATALEPDNPNYLAGAAAAHLRLGYATADETARRTHLVSARLFLEQLLTIDPDSEFAHFNLGWLLLESDSKTAAVHFRQRLRLLPDRPGGYLGLGLALLETGDKERARSALALEAVNDPRFLTAPLWDVPALASERPAVVQRAQQIADEWANDTNGRESRDITHLQSWLRWWCGDDAAAKEAWRTAPAADRDFFAGMTDDVATTGPLDLRPETPGWIVLARAAADPAERRELLGRYVLLRRKTPATAEEIRILEELVARLGRDWRAWLQAPEGCNAPFVKSHRPERVAFAVIARNLDLPVPVDAWLVQENEIARLFFEGAFPEAGWLSDAQLLDYVRKHDL